MAQSYQNKNKRWENFENRLKDYLSGTLMNLVDLLLLCVSVTLKHVLFKFCTQGQMIQLLVFLFLLVKKKVLVAIRVTKSIACLKSTSCQVTFLSYKHLYGHMPSSCQHYNNTNIHTTTQTSMQNSCFQLHFLLAFFKEHLTSGCQ